ncbi:MAG: hypothetical protein KatS3mg084_0092 [Candidatus Dojkabacteria bacterium]|jgi:Na+/melibiose symporter-like transporter|nr:MAG: hypothetical protein KatS3mg084_0092 [Candidatus Dojkabacteria bacterium]
MEGHNTNNHSEEIINEMSESTTNTTNKNDQNRFKNISSSLKIGVGILGVILVIVLIISFLNVWNVYTNASKYKRVYDQIREEVRYCKEIQNTAQPRDNFVYCDRILEKFKELTN